MCVCVCVLEKAPVYWQSHVESNPSKSKLQKEAPASNLCWLKRQPFVHTQLNNKTVLFDS